MKGWMKFLALALGLALFAWFVHRAGWREVAARFEQVGPWLLVGLLPYLLVYVLDTLGWRFAFPPDNSRPSYFTLLRIRWAGEAVNNVVPTGYVGGEAVKAWLLHRRGLSLLRATTSVVVSKTAQVTAQVVFIALGAALAVTLLPPTSTARPGFALLAAGTLAALGLCFWIQSHGLFSFVRVVALRLRIRKLAEKQTQLRQLDDQIFGFYRKEPRSFAAAGVAYLAGWLADAMELFVVSHLLGFPMDYGTAIVIESFISIAKALGFVVPGALGVQESGVWLLFALFGFTESQAVTYAILRRGREVIYAAVGTALLYAEGLSLRGLRAQTQAEAQPGTHPIS
jgi:putative membrane protein